jgi:hypothetical protein
VLVDENSQPHSIPPKQITYEIAGETYKPSDIPKFLKEVEVYSDPSSLEVAWELLVGDGETADPESLAVLLFSDRSAAQCYAAYCLLSTDKLYFKQKGDRYEPRSVAQVAEIKTPARSRTAATPRIPRILGSSQAATSRGKSRLGK